MYTKNPVTGRNETLVNTSMLKGAVDGVTAKIADKADKGVLESLSEYAVGIAEDINDKADKSEVQTLSEYVEGRLPKDVYTPLVDAYVGLACKVADPDVLEGAAKMAFAADPVKYATSNPNDEGCAEVIDGTGTIFNAIRAASTVGGGTVELPPFLRLKSWTCFGGFYYGDTVDITSWKTELPNLVNTDGMFYKCTNLTSWTTELPNLTNGNSMFDSTAIEEWTVELPNLTSGYGMFTNSDEYNPDDPAALKRFRGTLPSLVRGDGMFTNCPLDLESIRCIAETINDVNDLAESAQVSKRIDICVGYDIESTPLHEEYVETIKNKGWTVTVNDIQQ